MVCVGYADLSATAWDRGFDLTLRLRDTFLALRLGWTSDESYRLRQSNHKKDLPTPKQRAPGSKP